MNKAKNIIAILLMIVGFGLLVGSVFIRYSTPKEEPKKEEKKEDTLEEKLDIDVDSARLKLFIDAALHDYNQAGATAVEFLNGIGDLDAVLRYSVAIYASNKSDITKDNLPDKYKDTETGSYLLTLPSSKYVKFDDFNHTYKKLFNESYNPEILKHSIENDGTNEETISTCPHLYLYDEDNEMIIFSSQCGGMSTKTLLTKIYDYKNDDNYIYVYQYAGYQTGNIFQKLNDDKINVKSFDGNESKFSTIIWKFDTNYNFISTEVKS